MCLHLWGGGVSENQGTLSAHSEGPRGMAKGAPVSAGSKGARAILREPVPPATARSIRLTARGCGAGFPGTGLSCTRPITRLQETWRRLV